METRRIKLTDLVLNEGQIAGLPTNPRQWTKTELDKLKKSLKETPELLEARGILVYPWEGKYLVLVGNMRLSALKALKAKDAPCVIFPENTPIDKLKEVVIKDNGSFGEWDFDSLANEWGDLPLTDWGVPAWETSEEQNEVATEVQEDDFDESEDKVETRCQKGDVWQLGDHRLMCGDSTAIDDVKKLLDGDMADFWLTDPPYNVDYAEKEQYKLDLGYAVSKHEVAIANDKMSNEQFREFLRSAFLAAKENMRPGAAFYIWYADTEVYNFRGALLDIGGMKVAENLIWVKNALCFGRQDYHWQHEPCLYGWKEGAGHSWYSDRSQTTILKFDKPKKSELHPTMKPLEIFGYQMKNSSKVGDIVYDSFGGSGTTLVVAEQLGRKARLMEFEPHYCDVIIARWEKLTGKEAVRVE